MHRTQIQIDEPLYEALRREAFERRISMAQMVREALGEYLARRQSGGGIETAALSADRLSSLDPPASSHDQ